MKIPCKPLINKDLQGIFILGSGIGIRTPTNRVRVCRATVTQFRFFIAHTIIPIGESLVNSFFQKNIFYTSYSIYLFDKPIIIMYNDYVLTAYCVRRCHY